MTPISKGEAVTYVGAAGVTVEAIVRTMHRDGDVTVEARHVLNDDGSPRLGYLGYRYRAPISKFTKKGEA